jgi:hypothetical protein
MQVYKKIKAKKFSLPLKNIYGVIKTASNFLQSAPAKNGSPYECYN